MFTAHFNHKMICMMATSDLIDSLINDHERQYITGPLTVMLIQLLAKTLPIAYRHVQYINHMFAKVCKVFYHVIDKAPDLKYQSLVENSLSKCHYFDVGVDACII